ncbi:uncharacterized protein VICG_01976 [Vittaforma corneae ATCC 50505]|uniref:GPI ethanolamine phosphate transferase 1 n=1 Tax=Vittaforma corneae (strain ATCC 50505) TaxID=993615 RepID=L2GL42_VITCO|nr:uncharacterized protein VICG_01976 [Vittaforma corneae ATCC 50505]ELA41017.1 hypothetical protein VICG_01976 [Vittaforma corneae ATCC 50505]
MLKNLKLFKNLDFLRSGMFKTFILVCASIVLFYASMFRIPETSRERSTVPLSRPQFKKLIYFVIDGLRFDGFVPTNKEGIYYNNFVFTKDPAVLKTTFFSVSSIPTATTCRVISLMTGAPSNLIEEVMTFFMSKVRIESLPDKLSDRPMRFYGDDLWVKSFEALKNNSFTFCGFSKADLATNETNLAEKVISDKDVDIKFIHTISVDAFGHVYGTVHHEKVREAQVRADNLLSEMYRNMDEDTLLVVTSDHGVTNEGAHGGSSKYEMASFCGFYSKKPILAPENGLSSSGENIYNSEFIRKFYDLDLFSVENDWIRPQNPYKIIHQDDILPTVCYLLGIPAPLNTYGNLIPYLVEDDNAQRILFEQKKKLLSDLKKFNNETDDCFRDYKSCNYELTMLIYSRLMGKHPFLACLAAIFGAAALCQIFVQLVKSGALTKQLLPSIPFIIAMVMVTHSYWSFASEDVVWSAVFLLTNFSFANLIFAIFFLKTPGRNLFAEDRINLHIPAFRNKLEVALLVALFFVFKNVKLVKSKHLVNDEPNTGVANYNQEFISNCLRTLPQLCYLLYSQIAKIDYQSKIAFLGIYPSVDSFFIVHMPPAVAILFIYFLRNIDFRRTQAAKHTLLAFCPYLLNLEKVQQSINYEVFFALTNKFGLVSSGLAALAYFVIPRYYVIRTFEISLYGMFLNLVSLLFCFVCSWVMKESLVFQYFFVGRLLFVTMFFIVDVLVEGAIALKRTNK